MWFQALFNFQKILCKKESEEVYKLILTNFNDISNVNSLLQKYIPIQVMPNSL